MIKELLIKNYRGFKDHHIEFKDITLMAGKNNAGKSTIIEILRLCSYITHKYKNARYIDTPSWVDYRLITGNRLSTNGISPDIKRLIKQYRTIYHKYEDDTPYAKILFENNSSIEIFYGRNEEIFAILKDKNGHIIKNTTKARKTDIPTIATLPQIGPLNVEEHILQDETIKKSEMLSVTSLHFRNKLLNSSKDMINEFREIVENSWKGLTISNVENDAGLLSLLVRENDFTAEVGVMGHGLQMWLQILWFIYTSSESNTLIIDEPDVYLHADLQKKLYEILKSTNKQIIISSHSLEFITTTNPTNILTISKDKLTSKYANISPNVQKIIDIIGYSANYELIKFANVGKSLYVEGLDKKLLSCFAEVLGFDNFDDIPVINLGGRSQWLKMIGGSEVVNQTSGNAIQNFGILDRDYYCDENNNKLKVDATNANINLYIWSRKEIENYLINPVVITRLINRYSNINVSEDDIILLLEEILDKYKDQIICQFGNQIQKEERHLEYSTITQRAREIVENNWNCLENKINICPGKKVLKSLKAVIKTKYNVSFKETTLIKAFRADEVHNDISECLKEILQ